MTAALRIRTLVVDDEPVARASIQSLLRADPDIELVGECGSGPEAVRAILAQAPELVFLDVEMPRMSGFDVLGAVGRDRELAVVFVTAFDSYAVDAFEAGARDYLLKPFDDRRFGRALGRAKEQVRRARLDALAAELVTLVPRPAPADRLEVKAPAGDRIAVRDGDRIVFVELADIDWIEAYDYYVQLHAGAKVYLLRESLRQLEAELDPARFLRIHRSAIVAIDRVVELRPGAYGDYAVRLSDGTELKLSRARRDRLRALLRAP